jgi:methionine synthase II (cobalamin-independent)
VGLDFTCGAGLIDTVASCGSPKPLALGLVDGRRPLMEKPAAVARQVERLFARIQGGRAYLGPSCGVEYLTSAAAFAKFAMLPTVVAELDGQQL